MNQHFRIGSTSYVYPDDILPNVRKLASVVQDIELVLFEADEFGTNLPDARSIAELTSLSRAHDLSYTVHLPLDLRFGDVVSMHKARRGIEATLGLDPFAYVMHLDGRVLMDQPSRETVSHWERDAASGLAQVVKWIGDRSRVCVENVEAWDPGYFSEVVAQSNVSRCVDVGHFWLQRADPLPHLLKHLPRTRVVHMHGVGSRDHQSLRLMPQEALQSVVHVLFRENYSGVLTLEVFGVEDFFTSLEALNESIARETSR